MKRKRHAVLPRGTISRFSKVCCGAVFFTLILWAGSAWASERAGVSPREPESLLSRENLIAWEIETGDTIRGPEERAQMLRRLGFKRYAHKQEPEDVSEAYVDREIEALQQNGIELSAWMFFVDEPDQNPQVRMTLEAFRRHGVRPQLWVTQSLARFRQTADELKKAGVVVPEWPEQTEDIGTLPQAEQVQVFEGIHRVLADMAHYPKTPQEQEKRLAVETARVQAYARLAESYGLRVELYNHNGWFAVMENLLAIIERLKTQHVANVGLVYNFCHAIDPAHDDTKDFPRLWQRIRPHVSVVGISGVRGELENLFPSQGDHELDMMRAIERSGWRGPVGILGAYVDRDPERGLKKILIGTEWLAAELEQPGSGGPRPFPDRAKQPDP